MCQMCSLLLGKQIAINILGHLRVNHFGMRLIVFSHLGVCLFQQTHALQINVSTNHNQSDFICIAKSSQIKFASNCFTFSADATPTALTPSNPVWKN